MDNPWFLLLVQLCLMMVSVSHGTTTTSTTNNRRSHFFSPSSNTTNKFGIGVYNDTAMAPSLDVQLPEARALTGKGGFVLLFFDLLFSRGGDPGSCENDCQPPTWAINAVEQAYSLGLTPIVRLGQWSRQIRNFADDHASGSNRNYTSLAQAYKTYAAAFPRPPDGSDLLVVLLNEPNVCGEWQCDDGPGQYVELSTMAAEAASCLRDLLTAVQEVPRVRVAVAPLAYASPARCECTQPGHNPPVNFSVPNDAAFITAMRVEVPDLWTRADYFTAHPYPFGDAAFSTPGGRAGVENYRTELQAVGLNGTFPVAITETGWRGTDEAEKASSMVAAYKEVCAVCPRTQRSAFS